MSEHFVRVIPTVPGWVPNQPMVDAAQELLRNLCPRARDVSAEVHDEVVFVDPGEGLAAVRCPACGQDLLADWWPEQMDKAFATSFADLDVETPCCSAATSLNALAYDWPAGFSRFVLTVDTADRGPLTDDELTQVASTLGHPVRQVLAMY